MKLKKIVFDRQGFRNLRELEINIAPRITVIAGHNGIGKSTILGLIANGTESKTYKTLLNKKFRSDFSEIFYLDYEGDYNSRDSGSSTASLVYEARNIEIEKLCSITAGQKEIINRKQYKPFMAKVDESTLTQIQIQDLESRTEKSPHEKFIYIYRLRLIPRTQNSQLIPEDIVKEFGVSDAGKIGLPTIYLGMSRISPIGEFDQTTITHKKTQTSIEVLDYINDFFNSIIPINQKKEDTSLYVHTFGKSNKQSLVPELSHSSLTISLGQDSLSSIATAFASFWNLKNQMGSDYKGGILVIDEIEAGFHPKAQLKMMKTITKQARDLDLQVILTSHSLTIIKSIFDSISGSNPDPKDKVVYLMDTIMPRSMENPTYSKIKKDMLLEVTPTQNLDLKPKIKIYFEDNEAKYFFEKILESNNINNENRDFLFATDFETISLEIGCEILVKLVKSDGYFKNTVLISDNDVASKTSNKKIINEYDNFCVLPASNNLKDNDPSHYRNPEMLIYRFLEEKLANPRDNREFWLQSETYTTDYVREHIVIQSLSEQKNRVSMKKWFNDNLYYFNDINIIDIWCKENIVPVSDFITQLSFALDAASRNKSEVNHISR